MIEDVAKRLFFEVVVKAAITRVVAAVPFLGWPVVGTVFQVLVMKFAGILYEELQRLTKFTIIDIEIEKNRKEYDEATSKLKDAIEKDEDVEKAKEEYKNNLRDRDWETS